MMTERLKSGVGRRKGQEEELMTLGWSIQYDTVRVRAEQRTGIWVCLLLPAQCPEDNWVLYIYANTYHRNHSKFPSLAPPMRDDRRPVCLI